MNHIELGMTVRAKFPIFQKKCPLAYLDSAASAQKPYSVVQCMSDFYSYEHANIHRGAYELSALATERYEDARNKVAQFIGAEPNSVIFTRGATESINLVSYSLENYFSEGDVIILTELEHHSNIVPWQLLAERRRLKLLFARVTDAGDLDYAHFEELLRSYQPKLVACTMLSNALGTVTEVNKILSLAKNEGALVLLDAAQAVCHMPIRVKDLAADFLVFSGHKLYGPTGIGVLYVRHECFDFMQPFLGGGDMIETVSVNGSTWAEPPQKFEAGTPPIAEAIGLGAAIDFVSELSWSSIQGHERALFQYAHQALSAIPGVRLLGPGGEKQVSIISFTVEGLHPHDLATIADSCNVQIRAGHHCAMPLLSALEVPATARMSLGIYSTKDDIDRLVESVKKAQKIVA